jgi:VWFA-related protein
MRVTSELVLVNVVARDKKGNLIRDLKKEDFTVTEDGKRQQISTFDFENVDELATAGAAKATITRSSVAGYSAFERRQAQHLRTPGRRPHASFRFLRHGPGRLTAASIPPKIRER